MKLRRIEIQGFKSFRFKTGIEVSDGVTAIVGPNGCGKSNVVDAIRWAMGSQSPKDLRGRAMEDIIFAGSENYKPHGMAEVSLLFENDRGDVPLEWKDCAEIKVTRRLFRTGESEYEMNGGRVRLRDLQALFLGTGVGSREAYSIIEQGRIGFIVSARPEERRSIIEEAAGITRYKYQRKTAERRLVQSKQNLSRVADVLDEIARQLASLERQARKAAQWRVLTERQRILEMSAALARRDRAFEARDVAVAGLDVKSSAHKAAGTAHAALQTRVEQAKVEVAVLDRKLADATELNYRERTRAELLRNNVVHQERESESLTQRIASAESGLAQQAELQEQAVAALQIAKSDHALAVGQLAESERALEALTARHDALKAAKRNAGADERTLADAMTRARGEAATVRARLDVAVQDRASLQARVTSATERVTAAAAALAAAQSCLDDAASELTDAHDEEESLRYGLEDAKEREATALERRTETQDAHRAATEGLRAAAARSDTLERMARSGEGYAKAVRAVLKAAERGEVTGVGRPLLERLRVDAAHAASVAALLGSLAEAVCVDDMEAARATVDWAVSHGHSLTVAVLGDDAVIGALGAGCTAVEPIPLPIASRLRDAIVGSHFAGGGASSMPAVTPDVDLRGVIRVLDGVWAVGAGAPASESVMRIQRERDEAQAVLSGAEQAVVATRRQLGAAEESLEIALQTRAMAQQQLDGAVDALRAARGAHADANQALQRCQTESKRSEEDRAKLAERTTSTSDAIRELTERRDELESGLAAQERGLAEARARYEEANLAEETAGETLSNARVSAAEQRERSRNLSRSIEQLQNQSGAALSRRLTLQQELTELADRVVDVAEQLRSDRDQLGDSVEAARDAEIILSQVQDKHSAAVSTMRTVESEQLLTRRAVDDAFAEQQRAELQLERLRAELEHAEEAIAERFHLSVAAARRACAEVPFTDDAKGELAGIVSKLDRLGAVNPAAEEEYTEALERHDYLAAQRDDLQAAISDLETAIRKMDATSRELFETTFNEVAARFEVLFPRLFEGGKGRLSLTDPDNMLETGVEIVVQPPGKRLQSMTLMSGGEKALTAVALVFAIFQLKPTPFCLLDEVDAPLDDANVGRFASIVNEMSDTSQFLIITHNKTTMEAGDTLYGVTMEEPGVSKVVGVRMQGELPA